MTVSFEVYNGDFFVEFSVTVPRADLPEVISNLQALPNVRNLKY